MDEGEEASVVVVMMRMIRAVMKSTSEVVLMIEGCICFRVGGCWWLLSGWATKG